MRPRDSDTGKMSGFILLTSTKDFDTGRRQVSLGVTGVRAG